jgi:tetratricopeptide (TPR) repeat protein
MHVSKYKSELSLTKGDYSKAMDFAEDTLVQGQNKAAKKYISMGWKLQGDVFMAMEKFAEATNCFEKARDLADQMGYPPLIWKTRFSLGQIYNQQGKYEAAKESIAKAGAIIKQMASNVSDSEVKQTFLNSKPIQDVYNQLNSL